MILHDGSKVLELHGVIEKKCSQRLLSITSFTAHFHMWEPGCNFCDAFPADAVITTVNTIYTCLMRRQSFQNVSILQCVTVLIQHMIHLCVRSLHCCSRVSAALNDLLTAMGRCDVLWRGEC